MSKYKVPDEYYYRLHHVRPRFKGDIENVLLFIATEISKLPDSDSSEYTNKLNDAIRAYPGNKIKTEKTINNWRTEISALFAFYVECKNGTTITGLRAKELAEKQDLVETFKKFLFLFQYPGAHIKPHEALKMIEAGIRFKPAQYILKVLKAAEAETGNRAYLSKEEVCHCIFNDLRCTRDNENPQMAWERILTNRQSKCRYDKKGDIIRYAGDIIDYMVIANLLIKDGNNRFSLNSLETDVIQKFISSNLWFTGYDSMITKRSGSQESVRHEEEKWFKYANLELDEADFETNLLAFISTDSEEYEKLEKTSLEALNEFYDDEETVIDTKVIGDIGESMVHSHECQRVKIGDRKDLIHLIKRMPTHLALGYDIQSVELDERKRYIEVKTTISSNPLKINRIHLTTNEWNTAETVKDRYFIYRLSLNKLSRKLFIIQDPVELYKKNIIKMTPRNGAEINYDNNAGIEENLLLWTN